MYSVDFQCKGYMSEEVKDVQASGWDPDRPVDTAAAAVAGSGACSCTRQAGREDLVVTFHKNYILIFICNYCLFCISLHFFIFFAGFLCALFLGPAWKTVQSLSALPHREVCTCAHYGNVCPGLHGWCGGGWGTCRPPISVLVHEVAAACGGHT